MLKRNTIIDNLHVYFIVFSAFFFSYIPLIYVLNFIGIGKEPAYALFMLMTIGLLILNIFRNKIQIYHQHLIVFGLSLLFGIYTAVSYSMTTNYFNDSRTLLALAVLNPAYILFAALISHQRKHVLAALYLMTTIYFVIVTVQWLQGNLEPDPNSGFIQIFDAVDNEFYQNINNYLGLMAILTTGLFSWKNRLINIIKIGIIGLVLLFMLKIADRSSVIALLLVLIFWFSISKIKLESRFFIFFLIIIIIVSLFIMATKDTIIIAMQESDIRAISRMSDLFTGTDQSHRGFLFNKAMEQFTFSSKNLFFGGGMNTFSIFSKEYDISLYPHNIILQVLAEYGVIGFSFFISPIYYLFKLRYTELGSIIGSSKISQLFFMIFLYFLIIYMFTGNLSNSWSFIFLTFLLLPSPQLRHP